LLTLRYCCHGADVAADFSLPLLRHVAAMLLSHYAAAADAIFLLIDAIIAITPLLIFSFSFASRHAR
jgi:hypothetical protein